MAQVSATRPLQACPPALREAGATWLVLLVLLLGVFHDTAWSMVRIWLASATYGHGMLIVPISVYLVWRRRHRLATEKPSPSLWGLAFMLGAGTVWLVGHLAMVNLLQHFGLVGLIQGSVLAVFGVSIARVVLFPLAYLLLAVPFGDFAVPPLQDLTAVYTVELLRLTGVPVFLEHWQLVIPGGAFLVAEACAGVRYLLACIALGLLVCDLLLRTWWKRLLYLALAVAVPIVANVVRAYGIVMLAHLSGFEIAVGVDHLVYGGVFLSFVTLILIALAVWMADRRPGDANAVPAAGATPAGPGGGRRANLAMMLAVAGAVVVLRGYGAWASTPATAATMHLELPDRMAGWEQRPRAEGAWRGDYPGADLQQAWTFRNGVRQVSLYIAYYTHERPGAELIASRNSLLGHPDAQVAHRGMGPADLAEGLPPPAEIRTSAPGEIGVRVVWSWNQVGDTMTTQGHMAKLLALKAKLLGSPAPAAVLAVSSHGSDDGEAAKSLRAFLTALKPRRVLFALREGRNALASF